MVDHFLRNDDIEVFRREWVFVQISGDKSDMSKPLFSIGNRLFRQINTGYIAETRKLTGIPSRPTSYIQDTRAMTSNGADKLEYSFVALVFPLVDRSSCSPMLGCVKQDMLWSPKPRLEPIPLGQTTGSTSSVQPAACRRGDLAAVPR